MRLQELGVSGVAGEPGSYVAGLVGFLQGDQNADEVSWPDIGQRGAAIPVHRRSVSQTREPAR